MLRTAKAENKTWAITRLQAAYEKLGQLPKKEDFDELTRMQIKAFLDP